MRIKTKLFRTQRRAARAWIDNTTEEICFGGSKGGGKSNLGCQLIFGDALIYPGSHYFIARKNRTDLKRFTIPSIYEAFDIWGLDHKSYIDYNGGLDYFDIFGGSRVYLIDCKYLPSDPDFSRLGSMQFTRGWIEEGAEIDDEAIINLSATVGRWKNIEYNLKRKLLITTNPTKGLLYDDFFNADREGTIGPERSFIRSTVDDNRFISEDYKRALERLPPQQRARLRFGDWDFEDNPDALVSSDQIVDIHTNNHVDGGERFITADVAFEGSDRFVVWVWNGWRIVDLIVMKKSDGKDIVDTILKAAERHGVPRSRIAYDAGGVGTALKGFLRGAKPFIFNGRAENEEQYKSIKDQCGFNLARRIREGEIYVACNLGKYEKIVNEELKESLIDGTGGKETKLKLKDKKLVKKVLGRSPDFFDAMLIRESFEFVKIPTLKRRQ